MGQEQSPEQIQAHTDQGEQRNYVMIHVLRLGISSRPNDLLFQTRSSRLTSSGGTRDDPFGPEESHDHRKENGG
jgi:hypothetical protein